MIAFIVSTLLFAEPRPTAEQVAKAVNESRAAIAEKNPQPTVAQQLSDLGKQIEKAEASKKAMQGIQNRKEKAAKIKVVADQIDELRAQFAATKSGKIPPPEPQLDAFDMRDVPVGRVGVINRPGKFEALELRCVKIVSPTRVIVSRESSAPRWVFKSGTMIPSGTIESTFTFVLVGVQTDGMTEGKSFRNDPLNVIAVGSDKVVGRSQPVPVLEVFNPDEPFK